MKKINLIVTVVLSFGLLVSTVLAATYTAGAKVETRVGGYVIGEATAFGQSSISTITNLGRIVFTNLNDPGQAIGTAAEELEDTVISFGGSVDNVSGTIVFERESSNNAVLKFDSFNVTVNDLFGRLSLRFYDWTYAAGGSANEGDYILADIGFQGIYAKVKAHDLVSVGAGFGLNANSIRGIRLDLNFGGFGDYLKTDFYFGLITHSVDNENKFNDGFTYTTAAGDTADIGIIRELSVERLQLGFETKIYSNYLKIGVGATVAGSALEYYTTSLDTTNYFDSNGGSVDTAELAAITTYSGQYTRSEATTNAGISFVLDLSGKAEIVKDLFSISYGFQYSPDNIARYFAAREASGGAAFLGDDGLTGGDQGINTGIGGATTVNADGTLGAFSIYPGVHAFQALQNGGTDFTETFALTLTPAFSVGQFIFSLPLAFEYYNAIVSGYQVRDTALTLLSIDLVATWKPADGFFVQFRGEFDFHNHTEVPGLGLVTRDPVNGELEPTRLIVDGVATPGAFNAAEISEINARTKVVNELGGYAPRITETRGSTKGGGLAFSDFFVELRVGATFGISSSTE